MAEVVAKYKLDVNDAVKNLDKLQSETKQLDNNLDKAGKSGAKSLEKVGKESSVLSSAFKKLGGVIAAAFAVDRIISFGKEAVRVAAQAEGIERAFNKLNRPNLLANLRRATRGTVTDLELMRKAVRANNFQIPLDKLATFFEFATKRSIETGESVDYLVNSIVDGIGRKSTLVLDNLGISASQLQEEIKRTGDFGQAAANIIEQSLEETGIVADTTSVKLARLTTTWKNFTKEVGDSLIVLGDFILKLDEVGRVTNRSKEALEDRVESTAAAAISVAKLSAATGEEIGLMQQTRILLFGLTDAEEELIAKYERSIKAKNEDAEATRKGNGAITEYVRSLAQLNTELKTLQEEFQNAEIGSDAWWNALDKIEKKTQEVFEAAALSNLSDALKVDVEEMPDITGYVVDYQEEVERTTDIADKLWQAHFDELMAKQDEAAANEKKNLDLSLMITQEVLSSLGSFATSISQIVQNKIQGDLQQLQKQYDEGLISREEFERKQVELQRKSAQAAKDAALFQAIIGTSQAVINALSSPGVPFPVAAGFAALAAAQGAVQIAAIVSEPLPQFAEGGLVAEHGLLKGKTHAQGGIMVEAEKDEFFVNAKRTRENLGLLKAVNDGTVESFIMSKYVKPMIDESLYKGFGDIGKSAQLNGITANLKDHNILHGLDRLRQSQTYGLNMVAGKLDKLSNRNTRKGW